MKYTVEMGAGATMDTPNFIKLLIVGGWDTQTHRRGDLIRLLSVFQRRKVG
jgi:hypothetical protein